MHLRLPFWTAFFALVAVGLVRAQAPAANTPPAAPAATQNDMRPGQIKVAKVDGAVSMLVNGTRSDLKVGDFIPQKATIYTAAKSAVILVFSNGSSTNLGEDSQLSIEEFLQDPFAQTMQSARVDEEPTTSRTRLKLTKGELTGKVAHLKREQGSVYTIETPVGAAGIRGTTFRIVFRPTGNGNAYNFVLSTSEGHVVFAQGTVDIPNAQPGTSGQTHDVLTQQEIVVTVNAEIAPNGTIVITDTPVVTPVAPINPATQAAIAETAQNIVKQQDATSFAPPAPSPPSNTGQGSTDNSKSNDQSNGTDNSNQNNNNSSNNSNNSNSNNTGNNSPGFTNNPPALTGGAGQPKP